MPGLPARRGVKGVNDLFFEVLLPFFMGFNLRYGAELRFLGGIALRGAKDAYKRVYAAVLLYGKGDVIAMA